MLARSIGVYLPLARSSLDALEHEAGQSQETEFWKDRRASSRLPIKFPLWLQDTGERRRSRWFQRRRLLLRSVLLCVSIVVLLIFITPIVNPSYTRRPSHYTGRNINGEKVFIAANIVDEKLIRGAWGTAVQTLIKLLGEENVYLSIYENDSGPGTRAALRELEQKIKCNSSIVSDHLDLAQFPTIQLPYSKEPRHRRIPYLAEVRNRALRPLDGGEVTAPYHRVEAKFDKLLFLNDVVFSSADAADLLFSTNVGEDGRTRYNSACAMDFINPLKFYDTFATRDAEGFGVGVPFFPWFSNAGEGQSRKEVLDGLDAVRVKSCWGGMVAFEASWFQAPQAGMSSTDLHSSAPLRFRAEEEFGWESSECCLLQADLQENVANASGPTVDWSGVYVNPYIRVAYDEPTFRWLEFSRRFERLYSPIHRLVNWIAKMPFSSPRREEVAGQKVVHDAWIEDARDGAGGHFERVERVAGVGGFCGGQELLVLKSDPKPGEKRWEKILVPSE